MTVDRLGNLFKSCPTNKSTGIFFLNGPPANAVVNILLPDKGNGIMSLLHGGDRLLPEVSMHQRISIKLEHAICIGRYQFFEDQSFCLDHVLHCGMEY